MYVLLPYSVLHQPITGMHNSGINPADNNMPAMAASHNVQNRNSCNFIPLLDEEAQGVKSFVLFIGYEHSGHSIIGSMMDAHPNMIIAHEYKLLEVWSGKKLYRKRTNLYNALYNNSYHAAKSGWRRDNYEQNKGYTLDIPNMWQGTFTELRVIGDKSGGSCSRTLYDERSKSLKVLHELQDTVGFPIKFIHVVRNPYDIVATLTVKISYVGKYRGNQSESVKLTPSEGDVMLMVDHHQRRTRANMEVQKELKPDMLEIHHADFIHNPKSSMWQICRFLDLDCPADYLQACSDKAFKVVSKSRHLMQWPSSALRAIDRMTQTYPFFKRYSFDTD